FDELRPDRPRGRRRAHRFEHPHDPAAGADRTEEFYPRIANVVDEVLQQRGATAPLDTLLVAGGDRQDVLGVGKDDSAPGPGDDDRKSTRLNSSHVSISYAVFCLKKKKKYSK